MLGNFQYAEHWPVVGDYDFQSYFFIQVLNVLMITYFNLAFLDIQGGTPNFAGQVFL